jgi:hypothetical protein
MNPVQGKAPILGLFADEHAISEAVPIGAQCGHVGSLSEPRFPRLRRKICVVCLL